MSVYVDNMFASYGRMLMSHMVADTPEELHRMADIIGIHRRWFQGDHYDISKGKRDLAIAAGAIPLTQVELGRMILQWRKEGRWRNGPR